MKCFNEFTKLRQKELEAVAAMLFMREVNNFNGQPFDPEPLVTCILL